MREVITNAERAEIYATAWRVYCTTQSSDYAYRKAATVGDKLGIYPLRVDEIARAAVERVAEKQRDFAKELSKQADKCAAEYAAQFSPTSNPYRDEV